MPSTFKPIKMSINLNLMKGVITLMIFFGLNNSIISQELELNKEFLSIEKYVSSMEELEEDISKAPVKWHLLHKLQVINGVVDIAANSNPEDFNSKSNFKWWYVATFGKIPRGQVKAPDVVNPSFDITEKDIKNALENAKLTASQWSNLEDNNFYQHHVLLDLNKRKIRRFLKVHTRHHLRIVRDITKER